VLAESFERIHRSNLIGMGVLPLQFAPGEDAGSLGLTGEEVYSVRGLAGTGEVPRTVTVTASGPGGTREFTATVRIDTPAEAALPAWRHPPLRPAPARRPLSSLARHPTPGSGPVPACQRPIAAYACLRSPPQTRPQACFLKPRLSPGGCPAGPAGNRKPILPIKVVINSPIWI
jgi:hypothetical protein